MSNADLSTTSDPRPAADLAVTLAATLVTRRELADIAGQLGCPGSANTSSPTPPAASSTPSCACS
jgi:hypothetical protein